MTDLRRAGRVKRLAVAVALVGVLGAGCSGGGDEARRISEAEARAELEHLRSEVEAHRKLLRNVVETTETTEPQR